MCKRACVQAYVRFSIRLGIYVYACLNVHAYVHVCVRVCAFVSVYIRMRAECMYVNLHAYVCI